MDADDVETHILSHKVRKQSNSAISTGAQESHVAQSCYSVIGEKPFLWSKRKFDPP